MKVISLNGGSKLRLKKTSAAIGIFDGVHRGHQYLIKQMLAAARRLGARPIVITFFPHPAHVLRPDLKLEYLTSFTDRLRLLADLGVSACILVRFNRSFAKIRPQAFIKNILVKKLGVKAVFVGEDFRFGKDRSGDIALFQRLAPEYGYEMHAVPALKEGKDIISSTRIRQSVETGQLNKAAQLLGRRVCVSGMVVRGSQRGKSLGFPTANIALGIEASAVRKYLFPTPSGGGKGTGVPFILPPKGVYAVQVTLGKKKYPAMANIGTRPSFEQQISKLHLEVHILDFSKNIYGRRLEVDFLKKIRNEKKFSSPQALIRQIQKDEAFTRAYFI